MPFVLPTPSAIVIVTKPATAITDSTATLWASVNPGGADASIWFQWGTSTAYDQVTSTFDAGAGTADVLVAITIFGLTPNTTYHFRGASDTAFGDDLSFTTTAIPAAASSPSLSEPFEDFDYAQYDVDQAATDDTHMGRIAGVVYDFGLRDQGHVDLRTFNAPSASLPEAWTVSPNTTFSTGAQASFNHWPGLVVSLPFGIEHAISSTTDPVDLSVLGPDATLMVALPNCPLANLALSGCFLSLTSAGATTTVNLPFSASENTLVAGNTYASWPVAEIVGIDLTTVTDVTLVLNATAPCTLTVMALRLVGPAWVPKDVDFDTWNHCLRQCIPPNGDVNALPVPNNQVLPPLWHRSGNAKTPNPRPINATFAVVFNTGSQLYTNSIRLNLRDVNGVDTNQLQLDGQLQVQLDGPQPGLSTSTLLDRTVGDLDMQGLSLLDTESMKQLETIAATIDQSWISFRVAWGTVPEVAITRSFSTSPDYRWIGNSLTFADGTHALQSNTYYLALVNLTDTQAQLQIYTVDQTTLAVHQLWFDTSLIDDSYRLIRRPGRMGWKANLQDGDASVSSIRPESIVFAEYRSVPLNSHTPVQGARLYARSAPMLQLWDSWSAVSSGGTAPALTPDAQRSTSGQSTRVDVAQPARAGQGIISNVLAPGDDRWGGIADWDHVTIDLDLWFPGSALASGATIALYLLSEDGNQVPLSVPRLITDQWQTIRAYAPPGLQSGRYRLGLTYEGTVAASFWIDSVSVIEQVLTWSARSHPGDLWVDFRDEINSDTEGVIFGDLGAQLQVRAQALRPNAVIIGPPKIVPIYAGLGRAVWPEDAVADPFSLQVPNVGAFTIAPGAPAHGQTITFTDQACTQALSAGARTYFSPGGAINWLWSFGDGSSANGPIVQHAYVAAGTYEVALTVEDAWGNRQVYISGVAVT